MTTKQRETLWLVAIGVAVVVFLYDRVAPSLKKHRDMAEKTIGEAEKFIKEKQGQLNAIKLLPYERIMLDMIITNSPPNPFARHWVEIIADQKNVNRFSNIEPVLSYNGFMRAGDKIIAIVNDEEYETGDKIEHVPLMVSEITSERINVENTHNRSTKQLSVKILPLEYED